uniref:Glycerol-3-phosphate dehydrogenase [NAD(+)] n=1 Tax=Gadus morhua TaxID=8049 RepID=A0A8C5CV46_GADMO
MPGMKVCIIGSGNWGSVIAKIVGHNVKGNNRFEPVVKMWVYEELIDGRNLTDIINSEHENVKYLPGHKLPGNVVAVPDITEAVKGAKVLIFVIPHQFIQRLCEQMKPHVAPGAIGISLIKGIDSGPSGLRLISDLIRESLEVDVSVLMGANIANEVADQKFCETTIGAQNPAHGQLFKELLQTPNFRITVVEESHTVELCGALKNIVAVGAGFCDGLGFGDNTKAASCGVADLITTCYGGRNRKVAEAFVRTSKSIEELEVEMLNGQKLQGPQTSADVYKILVEKDMVSKFPLFSAVYKICFEGKEVKEFVTCLQNHPEHM